MWAVLRPSATASSTCRSRAVISGPTPRCRTRMSRASSVWTPARSRAAPHDRRDGEREPVEAGRPGQAPRGAAGQRGPGRARQTSSTRSIIRVASPSRTRRPRPARLDASQRRGEHRDVRAQAAERPERPAAVLSSATSDRSTRRSRGARATLERAAALRRRAPESSRSQANWLADCCQYSAITEQSATHRDAVHAGDWMTMCPGASSTRR